MNRHLLILFVLCLGIGGSGCAMCSNAYDDCPPTFHGDGCGACDPMARSNSILSTPLPVATEGTIVTEGETFYDIPEAEMVVPGH